MNSSNQPTDPSLSSPVAGDLSSVEAGQAGDSLFKQFYKGCFRFGRRLLFVTIGVYLLMIGFLALFENRLVYPGSKYPRGNWEYHEQGYEEVTFAAADETQLFGWYLSLQKDPSSLGQGAIESPSRLQPRTILHCHGNGENIAQVGAYAAKQLSKVLQANVLTFDYRGFGKSEGSPNEDGLKEDADAALTWLCERDGVQPTDVIIVGHSLGGGLACYLAKKHGCKALILQRTFSSLPDAAARKYWMFPVHLIMRNRMNSAEAIKSCDVPLFQSHGDADSLVPIDLGRRVFNNSPSMDKDFFVVPGMTHWDPLPAEYWVELKTFVDQAAPRESLDEPASAVRSANQKQE